MAKGLRVTEEQFNKVKELLDNGETWVNIVRIVGIEKTTLQRIQHMESYKEYLEVGNAFHKYRAAQYYNSLDKERVVMENRKLLYQIDKLKRQMKREKEKYEFELVKLRKEIMIKERIR